MTQEPLRDIARAAHERTLERFDRIMDEVLRREGPLMEAKAREEGKEPHEAALIAAEHVNRVMLELQRQRARLEAQAVERLQ